MPKHPRNSPVRRLALEQMRQKIADNELEEGTQQLHGLLAIGEDVPFASDLDYLQAELEWIKARCVWLGARRKLAFTNRAGLLEQSDAKTAAAERRILKKSMKEYRDLDAAVRTRIDARRGATKSAGKQPALDELTEEHALSEIERTALLIAMGYALSSSFRHYLGMVGADDVYVHQMAPTVDVLFNFLDFDLPARIRHRHLFSRRATLVEQALITIEGHMTSMAPHELPGVEFQLTPETFDRMLGDDALGDLLRDFSALEDPIASLEDVVLPVRDKARVLSVVENHARYLEVRRTWGVDDRIRYGRGIVMLFHGRPGTGKTMTAHAIAKHMGKRVLNVNIPTFVSHHEEGSFFPALFRAAKANDAILFFDECETLFETRRHGNVLMTMLLTEIERFEGIAILATNLPGEIDEALLRRILVRMEFPEPDLASRAEIWRKHLPPRGVLADDLDVEALASRFEATGGYIKNAILMGVAAAVHRDPESPVLDHGLLEAAMNDQLRALSTQGERLDSTSTSLAELVLPDRLHAQLVELIAAARHRRLVFETWGIGASTKRGRGISALFHGDSGTGKTMAAEVVAHELGRPLLRCDASSVLSKYVGESEQNLAATFTEAKAAGAVLLFDEADALLRARGSTAGNDVHGDKLVATFLQLIERHDGVVILTTNLGSVLDPALERRFTVCMRFPLPDAQAREKIWATLLPPTVPREGELDLAALARRYEAAGGFIRNAVIKAAQRAALAGTGVSQQLLDTAAAEVMPQLTKVARVVGFER